MQLTERAVRLTFATDGTRMPASTTRMATTTSNSSCVNPRSPDRPERCTKCGADLLRAAESINGGVRRMASLAGRDGNASWIRRNRIPDSVPITTLVPAGPSHDRAAATPPIATRTHVADGVQSRKLYEIPTLWFPAATLRRPRHQKFYFPAARLP